MRVLTVGNMYPPHHLGGYELVWERAVEHLRAEGHRVRVLTSDLHLRAGESEPPETFRELRWYWRDHAWPRMSWPEVGRLERHNHQTFVRHLSEFAPDVVAWWSMGGMSLSLIERVRRAGIPAVAFVHDDWLRYGPQVDRWTRWSRRLGPLGRLLERMTGIPVGLDMGAAARYLFVSDTVRRAAPALPQTAILSSGVSEALFDVSAREGFGDVLLYVGRIDVRKGVTDVVAALAALPAGVKLVLAGDGDPAVVSELRAQAERLGVAGRVRALGLRPRGDLAALYGAADVVLFPVRWAEPWGLVPLEAMAAGRPVIATGRGGSGEYLRDGENCLLVAAEDPAAIAAAVQRLAGDPGLRERLRRGGIATAGEYTETRFNAGVVAALERALAGQST